MHKSNLGTRILHVKNEYYINQHLPLESRFDADIFLDMV
jgi:hypothetical protein